MVSKLPMDLTTGAAGLMRRHSHALAVLMVAGCGYAVLSGYTQNQTTADDVRLTLSSQTVWQGEDGWCAFAAEIFQGRGALSYRCGGAGPFGTASPGSSGGGVRRRALTDPETVTLRKLYESSRLFDGGHIGADLSASDLPFHILMVRSRLPDQRSVVLVVTGNPTFSSGPRRALFDWLIKERQAMAR
jgi:hypothetical protein